MDNIGKVIMLPIPQVHIVGTTYIIPAKSCIPIYGQKFGDLKTAWNELLKALVIGISEQAILFRYAGPINDMTMPGTIQNKYPNKMHAL